MAGRDGRALGCLMKFHDKNIDQSIDHVIEEIQGLVDQLRELRRLQKLIAPKPLAITHLDVVAKNGCKAAVPTVEQSKLHGSN